MCAAGTRRLWKTLVALAIFAAIAITCATTPAHNTAADTALAAQKEEVATAKAEQLKSEHDHELRRVKEQNAAAAVALHKSEMGAAVAKSAHEAAMATQVAHVQHTTDICRTQEENQRSLYALNHQRHLDAAHAAVTVGHARASACDTEFWASDRKACRDKAFQISGRPSVAASDVYSAPRMVLPQIEQGDVDGGKVTYKIAHT